jgi:hypothetical protein
MKKITTWAFVVLMAAGIQTVCAIPTLQLDIGDGVYVGSPEDTTIATDDSFGLYALLQPTAESTVSGLYRISAALYPKLPLSSPAPDLGSFSFAGVSCPVVGSMTWGTPPEVLLADTTDVGADLPGHGVFETYFMEFDVDFSSASQCAPYDVQSEEGDPTDFAGSGIYYQYFAVDTRALDTGYGIHFDFYQVDRMIHTSAGNGHRSTTETATTDVIQFAPFSHDAASTTTRRPPGSIPDQGATLALLGGAMAAIAILRRRLGRG